MVNPMQSNSSDPPAATVSIEQFQSLIKKMYFVKDAARGIPATFLWLTEEIGELASALRETEHAKAQIAEDASRDTHKDASRSDNGGDKQHQELLADFQKKHQNLSAEFADVFAWLATIANVAEVDLATALFEKYGSGCPGCHAFVCSCPDEEKP